jgi:TolA-binding protein
MPRVSFNRITIASLIICLCLGAQDIDEAIRLFNSFQFDRARVIFNEVVKNENTPRIAEAYYYLGRLSLAPDSAISYYRRVIVSYPQSRYADISHLEIAKINIARKDYENAILTLSELLRKFPDTGVKDEALFWLGVSYISGGQKEQGQTILTRLRTDYPKSVWSERALNIVPSGETPGIKTEYYTIQVGSYRNKENAEVYASELHDAGYTVQVVEASVKGNIYYRVWVGKYSTLEEAKAFSEKLKASGIKGNVVKGY